MQDKCKEIDPMNADICRTTMTHESKENEMQVIFDQLQESRKPKVNAMQVISNNARKTPGKRGK